jgi:hypothetical protein
MIGNKSKASETFMLQNLATGAIPNTGMAISQMNIEEETSMRIARSLKNFIMQAGCLVVVSLLAASNLNFADHQHTSSPFQGPKANTGTVTYSKQGNMLVLTLSDDFVVPNTPAPHWQVVDSKGNVYLLNLLKIKGDKFNKSITVPSYVLDVAKVQIWCAFAEVLLGEAKFADPVR